MKSIFNKYNLFCLTVSCLILFASWTVYYKLPYALALEGLFAAYVVANYFNKSSSRQQSLFIVFFLISAWYYFPRFDFTGIFSGLFRSFVISSIFLLPYDYIKGIYKYFITILAGIVAFGSVAHLLRLLGIFEFPMIDMVFRDDRYYEVYPLLVYQNETSYRFASIFDEPGYLGTLCAFILALDGFNFKKIVNIILFIGGLLSLSFAFYLMIAIALLLITIRERRFGVLIISVLVIATIANFLPDFFAPIVERPELLAFADGTLTDERGGGKASMNIITSHGFFNMLFGNGYDAPLYYFKSNTVSLASSSVYRLIFQMGYLGLITVVLFIIKNTPRSFNAIIFTLLFILSLYQRPHIFEIVFTLLMAYCFYIKKIES